jgi:hypothetical protein
MAALFTAWSFPATAGGDRPAILDLEQSPWGQRGIMIAVLLELTLKYHGIVFLLARASAPEVAP